MSKTKEKAKEAKELKLEAEFVEECRKTRQAAKYAHHICRDSEFMNAAYSISTYEGAWKPSYDWDGNFKVPGVECRF